MLVLGRKEHDAIALDLENGEQIAIEVVSIIGNTVRLGISAPRSITVRRCELPPIARPG